MNPLARRAVAVLAAATVAVAVGAAAPARSQEEPARRVLLVSLPRVTWAEVADARPPVLTELLGRSAVASLSVRTIGPRTSLGEGYATLGAGNRATAEDAFAGLALGRDATYERGQAADVFRRRTGAEPDGAVLHLGIARVRASNDRLRYDAVPGALGEALRAAGIRTGVVANADVAQTDDPATYQRQAALAVIDALGRVAAGDVERDLVQDDPGSPFGLRLDADVAVAAVGAAFGPARVVLLEASDLERVDAYAGFATPEAHAANRARALTAADRLLGRALAHVDLERDLVIVLSPAAPRAGEGLTVFAMAGAGVEPGKARSASTRRAGFVTLPDVAPTVLEAVGVEVPDSMTGTAISSRGGGAPDLGDAEDFAAVNTVAVFREDVTGLASTVFVVFQVVAYGLAALAVSGRRDRPRLRQVAGFLALVVLGVPPVVFLMGLGRYDALHMAGVVSVMFAGAAVLAAAALAVGRGRPLVPPVVLVGFGLAVLLADVATGGRLQLNTVFGYSPIVAGRFAGFGNLAFALVAMSAIVVATGVWAMATARAGGGRPGRGVLVAVAAGLALVVVADGHPSLGSDVGGVLATVPAFTVLVLLLGGARLGWRRATAIAVATVAVIAVFAALDVSRPPDERTHLGRLVARVAGGDGGVLTIFQRKAESNVDILSTTVWTYVIPVALLFLAFLTWRPQGFLRRLLDRVPGLHACLVTALVAGVLGFALNDSGVAVPAMMLAVLLPYLAFLVVRTEPGAA